MPTQAAQPPRSRLAFGNTLSDSCVEAQKPLEAQPDRCNPATGPLAVGYVRVVAVPQANPGSGLDAQIATIRTVAEAEGIELVRVFEDSSESANNGQRPGLLALLAAVDAGKADVIVVPDLSRLARDTCELGRLMDSFASRGVRVISAAAPRSV